MKAKFAIIAVGALLASISVNSSSHLGNSPFPGISAAHAAGNGHGNGNGNGHGNGNGNGHGNSNGHGIGTNHGAIASALGALNAVHASIMGFKKAASTSRVGKIKAAMEAQADVDADTSVADAKAALAAALGTTVDALTAEQVNAALTNPDQNIAQLATNVQTAEQNLASQQTTADGLLAEAANKNPVSEETKAAVKALYDGRR